MIPSFQQCGLQEKHRHRHRGICVPRPVRLPEGLAAGLDSSDERLDRSEQPREKIFEAALNLRAPSCDQCELRPLVAFRPLASVSTERTSISRCICPCEGSAHEYCDSLLD